jgi:hypothetical protein
MDNPDSTTESVQVPPSAVSGIVSSGRMKPERSVGEETTKPDPVQESAGIEELIEEHILAKLDPDFLTYFTNSQPRVASQPPKTTLLPPIQDVREHPEAYQSPCALDTSKYPGVTNTEYLSQDGVSIPVRVYSPDGTKHGPGPYPVHLNFHGESSHPLTPELLRVPAN